MKKNIYYFYNICSKNIHIEDDNYYFSDNYNNCYCLYGLDTSKVNINFLFKHINELYYLLIMSNIYCPKIIYTKSRDYGFFLSNKYYILFKYIKNYGKTKNITINDIDSLSKNYSVFLFGYRNMHFNFWKSLWKDKIDYFESQISQFRIENKNLIECFNFCAGLVECSISLQNYIDDNHIINNLALSHRRIQYNMSRFEFYNPINMIFDYKTRDYSEYCKDLFFSVKLVNKNKLINDIINYVKKSNFSNENVIMLYVRLLYINHFFDFFEQNLIHTKKLDNSKVEELIFQCKNYELFLKELYKAIKKCGYYFPHLDFFD